MKFSIDKTKQPDVSWDGFSCWVYNSGDDFSSAKLNHRFLTECT